MKNTYDLSLVYIFSYFIFRAFSDSSLLSLLTLSSCYSCSLYISLLLPSLLISLFAPPFTSWLISCSRPEIYCTPYYIWVRDWPLSSSVFPPTVFSWRLPSVPWSPAIFSWLYRAPLISSSWTDPFWQTPGPCAWDSWAWPSKSRLAKAVPRWLCPLISSYCAASWDQTGWRRAGECAPWNAMSQPSRQTRCISQCRASQRCSAGVPLII